MVSHVKMLLIVLIFGLLAQSASAHHIAKPLQTDRLGPWDGNQDLYTSSDGKQFQRQGLFVKSAGVGNLLATQDGKLRAYFQWFPFKRESFDHVAVKVSEDLGKTWSSPQTITVKNLPLHLIRAIDPTAVELPGGKIRLYFAATPRPKPGGHGRPPINQRKVYSALSSDGVNFELEPGVRFEVEGQETYDPAIVFFNGLWHLYTPIPIDVANGKAYHAVSADGLNFKRLQDVEVSGHKSLSWIGNVMLHKDTLHYFGSGHSWHATSKDGIRWNMQPNSGLKCGDPSATVVPSTGQWLAICTSHNRPKVRATPNH